MSLEKYDSLWKRKEKEILGDYFTLLQFKSISSEPEFKADVLACADWVKSFLLACGLHVEMWQTAGHPTIFAETVPQDPSKPTLLIYNHYDVQPIDPLELWKSPPFEPTLVNGEVYARGAQDNKGQCLYVLEALKALIEEERELPINIKLCIEGEEECGSAGLAGIIDNRKDRLKADFLAIVDLGLRKPDEPSLTLGIRGLVTMDVIAEGTSSDLHSGSHGGLAFNPNHALIQILASLRDANGKITIPGFYDDVKVDPQMVSWLNADMNEKEYEKEFGAYPSGGEVGLAMSERNWLRPTLEVNGISGGYAGAGFKTVIPAKAYAKISCRLVPGQDPRKVGQLVARYIESKAPRGIKLKVNIHEGMGTAVVTNPHSPVVQAFAKAFTHLFGKPCQYSASGATIPICTQLKEASGADVVLLGFGLGSDNIHAPNEHFGVDRLRKGFLLMCLGIHALASSFLAAKRSEAS